MLHHPHITKAQCIKAQAQRGRGAFKRNATYTGESRKHSKTTLLAPPRQYWRQADRQADFKADTFRLSGLYPTGTGSASRFRPGDRPSGVAERLVN